MAEKPTHPCPVTRIYPVMANPERNDHELEGIRRANRDDDQHWRDKGWQTIEGGRDRHAPADPNAANPEDRPVIGADYTRAPFDESLVRDEHGNLRRDDGDVLRGYGEPLPEKNYPQAYNRDELINTNLNPALEYPSQTTATFRVWAILLGLVLFGLLIAAMYWGFLAPVRRTPNSKVQRTVERTLALQQFAGFVSRANERR